MTKTATKSFALSVLALGSPEFSQRCRLPLSSIAGITYHFGRLSEAWSLVVTHRPQLILIEIGVFHHDRLQQSLRSFLTQLRDRFGAEPLVAAALMAPQKFLYGGDLLFSSPTDLSPSGLMNDFLVLPPSGSTLCPNFSEQVHDLLNHARHEFERRADGHAPLPTLGAAAWVPSLADPKSRDLWMRWLPRYARYTNENPIIIGQTGTGKTRLAEALHVLSQRTGKFVSITPRDFSSSELVQAELFGAVAGAYTGAVEKWGLVKSAEGGTLFFDELQSIDRDLQGKLITFIENKAYRRVGSAETVTADVRFVFASNKSLREMMGAEILRDDFAYRLERVRLELIPLEQRRLDITAAVASALAKITRLRPSARSIEGLTPDAYHMLFAQRWPGNLRQLENVVARLCELTDLRGEDLIDAEAVHQTIEKSLLSFEPHASEIASRAGLVLAQQSPRDKISSLDQAVEVFQDLMRSAAVEACAGNLDQAAEMLKDNRAVLELAIAFQQNHGRQSK